MNNAEHIRAQVRWLAEADRITRGQLVEIVEELLLPFVGRADPRHFQSVNDKIFRLLAVSQPEFSEVEDDE